MRRHGPNVTIDPTGASQSIWIVDSGTDKVYEYANARSKISGSLSAANTFPLASGNCNPQGIADPPAPRTQLQSATPSLVPAALSLALDFDESLPPVTAFEGAVLRTSDARRDERALRVALALAMPGSPKFQLRDSSPYVIPPVPSERAVRISDDDSRDIFDEALLDLLAETDLSHFANALGS